MMRLTDPMKAKESNGLNPRGSNEVQGFFRYRRVKNRSLVGLGLALATLIVFHNPLAWDDGTVATAINYLAWAVLGASALAVYWADVRAADLHGYCRGKHGMTPTELRDEVRAKR